MLLSKGLLKSQYERSYLNESANEKRAALENNILYSTNNGYDIFLSHSSLDKKLVLGLVNLFNNFKYSVYVDWIEDTQLDRNNVSKTTASVLKNRMKQSKGLSYIPTNNSTQSKWCPWELGYFDGLKKEKCTILPVLEDYDYSEEYNGQEYLGLYPYIVYDIKDFYIRDSNGSYKIPLRDWLKN